ncbi:MAG TPA: sigma-70 family RNA polymerase sigma factor [Steroidobacteraceae bacterium]
MDENDWLAKRFDESRVHLRAVAYRMLGSPSEAEDAVQEAWLKLSRSDSRAVDNLGGWLTTVVARICLDMLRTRRSRREAPLGPAVDAVSVSPLEDEFELADAAGPALLVVLGMLAPAERVAFVLHDLFDLPFEEIARIVDCTPAAARQLASRARRRVHGAAPPPADLARQREFVSAFLAASRDGDFDRLLAVLSPDVVLHADEAAVRASVAHQRHGAPRLAAEVRGASPVANTFKGRAQAAVPALVDGAAGAVWASGGQVRAAFVFRVEGGRIARIDVIMDPEHLAELDVNID